MMGKSILDNVILRKGKKDDFKQFYKLFKIFEKEYCKISTIENYLYSEKEINDDFKNKLKNYFLVAEINNEIAGYFEGIFFKKWKKGYISDLFVLKNFRNQGIASSMTKQFIKELIKRKYKEISLDVNIKNPAIKTYENRGFKIFKYQMMKKL